MNTRHSRFDTDVCIASLCAALMLTSASLVAPAAYAQASSPTRLAAATGEMPNSTPLLSSTSTVGAADDDDFYETWTDPAISRERNVQMAGMVVIFLITAAVGIRHKLAVRRLARG